MITIENKLYQPYFKEFIKAKELKIGDKVKNHEYIIWINKKHRKFRKEKNFINGY